MAFSYFARLSPRDQQIYQRSDELPAVPLGDASALATLGQAVARALARDDRYAVEASCQQLVDGVLETLQVTKPVEVLVLARRPSNASSELHGLYTQDEQGMAQIRVWMRTAAQARVVAPRTFVRTLLHEVCHHLDFELFGLSQSFHTQGFYRRESSLLRQVLGDPPVRRTRPKPVQGELFAR